MLAAAETGLAGQRIGDGDGKTRNAERVRGVGFFGGEGDGERRLGAMADRRKVVAGEYPVDPILIPQKSNDVAEPRPRPVGDIDIGAEAVRRDDHVGAVRSGLEAGGDQAVFQGSDAVDGFVPMIGADDNQDVVTAGAKIGDGFGDHDDAGLGVRDGLPVLGGAKGEAVLGVVGFTQPEDGERRRPIPHRGAEALAHPPIAGAIVADCQGRVVVHRNPTGRE